MHPGLKQYLKAGDRHVVHTSGLTLKIAENNLSRLIVFIDRAGHKEREPLSWLRRNKNKTNPFRLVGIAGKPLHLNPLDWRMRPTLEYIPILLNRKTINSKRGDLLHLLFRPRGVGFRAHSQQNKAAAGVCHS